MHLKGNRDSCNCAQQKGENALRRCESFRWIWLFLPVSQSNCHGKWQAPCWRKVRLNNMVWKPWRIKQVSQGFSVMETRALQGSPWLLQSRLHAPFSLSPSLVNSTIIVMQWSSLFLHSSNLSCCSVWHTYAELRFWCYSSVNLSHQPFVTHNKEKKSADTTTSVSPSVISLRRSLFKWPWTAASSNRLGYIQQSTQCLSSSQRINNWCSVCFDPKGSTTDIFHHLAIGLGREHFHGILLALQHVCMSKVCLTKAWQNGDNESVHSTKLWQQVVINVFSPTCSSI